MKKSLLALNIIILIHVAPSMATLNYSPRELPSVIHDGFKNESWVHKGEVKIVGVGAVDLYSPISSGGRLILEASIIQFEVSQPVNQVKLVGGMKDALIRHHSDLIWEITLIAPSENTQYEALLSIDGESFNLEYITGTAVADQYTHRPLDLQNFSIHIY